MAEAPGLTDPNDSDMATAMEGVVRQESHESHDLQGSASAQATLGHKVTVTEV